MDYDVHLSGDIFNLTFWFCFTYEYFIQLKGNNKIFEPINSTQQSKEISEKYPFNKWEYQGKIYNDPGLKRSSSKPGFIAHESTRFIQVIYFLYITTKRTPQNCL